MRQHRAVGRMQQLQVQQGDEQNFSFLFFLLFAYPTSTASLIFGKKGNFTVVRSSMNFHFIDAKIDMQSFNPSLTLSQFVRSTPISPRSTCSLFEFLR